MERRPARHALFPGSLLASLHGITDVQEFMERTSHRLLKECLPEGYSSVGTEVNIHHLAPTPLGSQVRVVSEVTAIAGSQITLKVQAWDDVELCGEGEHTRFIIDEDRFLKRVQSKAEQILK